MFIFSIHTHTEMSGVKLVVLLGCLSILASMVLVLIIFGQRQAEGKLFEQEVQLNRTMQMRTRTEMDRVFMHRLLQQQHNNQKTSVDEIETEVNKLAPEVDKKESEAEVCQAEKAKKDEELVAIHKEQTEIEATFKAEKEAWTAEIIKLKEQIVQPSKVCEFLRKDKSADAKSLCAAQASQK